MHPTVSPRYPVLPMGISIVVEAEAASLQGDSRVTGVVLKDGRELPCDVFLVAAGIVPNVDLAREAGLELGRGVVVDGRMQTSAEGVYAAGDVCELSGALPGLWPVAVEQARVAAINAVGGDIEYTPTVPVTTLKVVGIDVTSIGRFEADEPGEGEIVVEEVEGYGYRKLVVVDGRVAGAILIGFPIEAPAVTAAVQRGLDVIDRVDALRAGDWACLSA